MKFKKSWKDKKLIVFDLDGTLTESKSKLDGGMKSLLAALLQEKKIAVIGGGKYKQFRVQFVNFLRIPGPLLKNLFIFPANSTSFYRYGRGRWQKIYEHTLAKSDRKKIFTAFRGVFREVGYKHPEKVYGEVVEDRGTQITFSAFGQEVVSRLGAKGIKMKMEWKKKHDALRFKMMKLLQRRLPQFSVKVGGLTSIDVTKKGIDKAYGVRQIRRELRIPIKNMLFVGDALYPGGNDCAARRTGVAWIQVSGLAETKKLIRKMLR